MIFVERVRTGIVVAVLLAIILFFRRNWWPHGAVLGRPEGPAVGSPIRWSGSRAFAPPFLFHLAALHLGVGIGGAHELLAAGPAEDPGDHDHGEDDVPGRGHQLLADRVGGRRRGVGLAESAVVFSAWVTPTPPGVAESAVGDRVRGGDRGDVVEGGRNPVGAEEDADDRQPRQVAAELGERRRRAANGEAGRGSRRPTSSCFRTPSSFAQKIRPSRRGGRSRRSRSGRPAPRGRRGSRA